MDLGGMQCALDDVIIVITITIMYAVLRIMMQLVIVIIIMVCVCSGHRWVMTKHSAPTLTLRGLIAQCSGDQIF